METTTGGLRPATDAIAAVLAAHLMEGDDETVHKAQAQLRDLVIESEQRLALLRDLRRLLDGGGLFTANQGPERDAAVAFLDRLNQLLPEDPRAAKARKEGS